MGYAICKSDLVFVLNHHNNAEKNPFFGTSTETLTQKT